MFEQAPALAEIGAAIDAGATIPTELIYQDWRTGDRVAAHPMAKDDSYVRRFGAPYYGLHRADLQKTLSTAFGAQNLHLACRLVNLVEWRDGWWWSSGTAEEHADLVVGADGVRSAAAAGSPAATTRSTH